MSRVHTLLDQLSESEYQLIDTERFKSQMRASRIAKIPQLKVNELHSSQPGFKFRNMDQNVELPVSHFSQPFQQKPYITNQTKKDLAQNRKEIEDLIYYDGRHKNSGYIHPHLGLRKEEPQEAQQLDLKESRFRTTKQNDEPKALNIDSRQTEHMVEMFERLSAERSRHGEAGYFKHKKRDIEEVGLDQLFSKYSQSAFHQISRDTELEQQQHKVEHFKHSAPNTSKHSEKGKLELSKSSQVKEKSKYASIKPIQHEQKQHLGHNKEAHAKDSLSIQCLLCKLSKLNLKAHHKHQTHQRQNSIQQRHQEVQKVEDRQTFHESRIMQVNASPRNGIKPRYLRSEDKKQFYRRGSVEPDQTWIEEGKLKKHYLRELQSMQKQSSQKSPTSQQHQLALQTSGSLMARSSQKGPSSQKYKTPRKKIFSGFQTVSSRPFIKIENNRESEGNYKQQTNKFLHNRSVSGSKSPYKRIFTEKQKPNKLTKNTSRTITRELNFNHIRQELIDSRVKIYRSKEKEKEASPSRKTSLIPSLRVLQMSTQVRKWYEMNRKEIVFQAERICSYDLIKRYMTDQEISSRLFKLVAEMIEPRRWVLMMVDEVYARLKDRYLPE